MEKRELYKAKQVVPMTKDSHNRLKKISIEESVSINQLIREGIKLILKKYEKKN